MSKRFGRSVRRSVLALLVAAGLVGATGAAQAGVIALSFTIIEGAEGQNIQDTCTDFVAGGLLCSNKAYRFPTTPEFVSLIYTFPGDNATAINRLIGLTEPGSNQVSDLVSIIDSISVGVGSSSLLLDFVSDNELGQFDLSNYGLGLIGPINCVVGALLPQVNRVFTDCIPETGELQVVFDNTNPGPGAIISVRSDAPEPASIALLGLGLAGLGCSRRRNT